MLHHLPKEAHEEVDKLVKSWWWSDRGRPSSLKMVQPYSWSLFVYRDYSKLIIFMKLLCTIYIYSIILITFQ